MASNSIRANLDEMVFRARNRAYGSYLLRLHLPRTTLKAFGIALASIVLFMLLPQIIKALTPEQEVSVVTEEEETEISLDEPPPIDKEKEPPPPPEEVKPPPPPKRSTVKYVPPKVVEAEEADKDLEVTEVDTIKEKTKISTKTMEGDADADPVIGKIDPDGTGDKPVELAPEPKREVPEDKFQMLQKQPKAVNMDAIKKNIEYPQFAKDAGISGKVTFRVLINKEGKYWKHKVMSSPHSALTKACVKHLPKLRFTPAIQGDKPIATWVTVPFNFRLNE